LATNYLLVDHRDFQDAQTMSRWKKQLIYPLLRISALVAILGLAYLLWTPGEVVRDGRFDRGLNGVWLQHGWLGDDEWFDG